MDSVQYVIIGVIAVVIIFLTVIILKSVLQPKKRDSIQKLIKAGKYNAAEKMAKAIIAKNPSDIIAHYYLGKAYLADNKSELALMEYKIVREKAIFSREIPEVEFRKQLSSLFSKFNQTEEALKEYILLTKLEPTNADNYFNAAKIYETKGRGEVALGLYQKAIRFNRRHVKAHASMGLLLLRSKQLAEAKKEIDLAISMSPETYSTYYYLGKVLKETKDYPGAVNAFEKALRDPEYRQKSLLERGSCYMMANAVDNAMLEFDKAVKASKDENSSETLYARYFLAACYEKNRKIDKAIEQWQIIYQRNHAFRDVGAKLSEYKDLQSNDSLKEFLTCSQDEFIEICKKTALKGLGISIQKTESKKWGVQMVGTEAKSDNWMDLRKQSYLLNFYRETEPIEDVEIRRVLDLSKSQNCVKAFCFASSGFTSTASNFAENRPIELVGKAKLEAILTKAGI